MGDKTHDLIDTYFKAANSRGLNAPAARKLLATELGRPALAEYKAIWSYKNRDELPADVAGFMIRYSIEFVVDGYPRRVWADMLSPPVFRRRGG